MLIYIIAHKPYILYCYCFDMIRTFVIFWWFLVIDVCHIEILPRCCAILVIKNKKSKWQVLWWYMYHYLKGAYIYWIKLTNELNRVLMFKRKLWSLIHILRQVPSNGQLPVLGPNTNIISVFLLSSCRQQVRVCGHPCSCIIYLLPRVL